MPASCTFCCLLKLLLLSAKTQIRSDKTPQTDIDGIHKFSNLTFKFQRFDRDVAQFFIQHILVKHAQHRRMNDSFFM